jgi:hypothetical protein
MDRMESAADPEEEGIQITLDLISKLQQQGGIHGVHILAPNQEEVVPRLVTETGLRETKPRVRKASGSSSKNGKHKPPVNLATNFANNSDTEYLRKLYP